MMTLIATKLAEVLGDAFLGSAVEHVVTNRRTLQASLSHSVLYRSRRLRVSMAQILSIQIDGHFVLIASKKRPERFGPIGGVVRCFPSERQRLEAELEFEPEMNHVTEKCDLRGFISGKNFAGFLRRYASGSGREQHTLAREIEEEFDEIGIPEIVRYVRRLEFVKERIVHEGPNKVKDRHYWQYRFFEIFTLCQESETSKRLAEFIQLHATKHRNLALASTDDIRRGKSNDGRIIGDSSGYLYSDNRKGFPPMPLF